MCVGWVKRPRAIMRCISLSIFALASLMFCVCAHVERAHQWERERERELERASA